MANIAKRPNGKWRARYRDAAGKEHASHFALKGDAERWLRRELAKLDAGTWTDPAAAKILFGEFAGDWLARQLELKPSTRQRYASLLKVHVLPVWSTTPLARISYEGVAKWVATLNDSGLSASSVRHAHRVLSLVLTDAVRARRLQSNPAEGVKLPRVAKPDKRFLTADQVATLADSAGPRGGLVVLTLAYTGLRFGELAALRAKRIDLMRRRIEVVESVTEVNGVQVFGTPKTHQRRTVPVPRFLVDALAEYLAGRSGDDLAFPAPKGGALRVGIFRRDVFDVAARDAGLAGLTPHELRHTAASLAVAAGGSVKDVQRMLGHASAAMTLDVYAGLFEDGLDDVADRLDAVARESAARLADRLRTAAESAPLRVAGAGASQASDLRKRGWGDWGLNPGPTDYESAALTG